MGKYKLGGGGGENEIISKSNINMLTDPKQLKGSLLIFLSSILFGSFGIWSVLTGRDFGVFFQGYVRAIIVLLFLIPMCIYSKSWVKIEKRDYKSFAVFSIFVVFTQAPLYYAFQHSGVGIASLVFFATYLITQYIFGGLFLDEKIGKVKVISFILAITGLLFVFNTSIGIFSLFALVMASINGIASGSEIASTKLIRKEFGVIQTSIIGWLAIVITHLPMSLLFGEKQIIPTISIHWIAMLCFAISGMLAFMFVVYGYKTIEASIGGLIGLLEIVFAILFGAIVFGEKITTSIVFGSLIILCSAMLPYLNAGWWTRDRT